VSISFCGKHAQSEAMPRQYTDACITYSLKFTSVYGRENMYINTALILHTAWRQSKQTAQNDADRSQPNWIQCVVPNTVQF